MSSPEKYDVDIIVVGACNYDLVSFVPRFPKPGETLQGSKFITGFGGKGANQCVTAGRLGAKTAMVAKVGNDSYGRDTVQNFKDNGVIADFVGVTEEAASGVATVAVTETGQNFCVIVSGANSLITIAEFEEALGKMNSPKILLCQLEIEHDISLAALKAARAKGVTTLLNPAPGVANLPEEFFQFSDIFCPNESETEIITGIPASNVEDAKLACLSILEKGCKIVVLTLGEAGCVYATKEDRTPIHIPAPKVRAVDTTGAGDSFLGSLAFYLAMYPSLGLEESLRRSCYIASVSVQAPGTQLSFPWKKDLPPHLF